MENLRKGRKFSIPSILQFISSRRDLQLITSNLTKVEIVRYLVAEWGCKQEFSEDLWERFLRSFDVQYIEVKEFDLDELIKLCGRIPTKKKTLVNLLHLQIAKRNKLHFLTGEKKLKEKYKRYYKKVLTYKDLRGLFV